MCAYKPKKKGGGGPQGRAKVEINASGTKMQVWFHPDLKEDFAGKKYIVGDWPAWVDPTTFKEISEWMVRMDGDKTKVYSLYPFKGVGFTGEVDSIASQKDKPPVPTQKSSQYGEYFQFTVLVKISDGPAKGAIVPYTLRYNFGPDEDGNVAYTSWGAKSVHSPRLDEFLTLAGAWDSGSIKYSDNILSLLQKRMLHAAKQFSFQIKDGYIISDSLDSVGGDWKDAKDDSDAALWDDEVDPKPEFSETASFEDVVDEFTPVVESEEDATDDFVLTW
jgi:hypothetical protein